MRKTGNKGVTLVEMIVVVALIALVLPLIYQFYIFGYETFTFNSRLIAQQYTVTNVMQHIRGDIQKAASVDTEEQTTGDVKVLTLKLGYYNEAVDPPIIEKVKYWRIKGTVGGTAILQYSGEKNLSDDAEGDFSDVVTGLEMDKCRLERQDSNRDKLIIQLKPVETNTGRAIAKNVREPIKTDISVLYKDKLDP